MSESERPPAFIFGGFDSPNTTQVPDAFFDVVAPELSEAELRVALYIIRRTFGFKKEADTISLRQMVDGITTRDGRVLDRGTGLKKSAVANALNGLERKGIILSQRNRSRERGNEPTTYALNVKNHPLSVPVDKGLSIHADKPLSVPVDIQHTEEQHTVKQQTETQCSNSFELQKQIFKTGTRSKFSKKCDSKIQNSAREVKEEPPGLRRDPNTFTSVGQVLTSSSDGRVPRIGPVAAGNGSRPPADAAPGTKRQSEAAPATQRPRGRPRSYPVPPDLDLFIQDISAEFHDASKLPSNRSFIGRVLHESGLPASVLYQLMQEARQITKAKGNIEKPSADDPGFRNRVPYWKKTLIDLIAKEGRAVADRRQSTGVQGREAP